MGNGMSIWSGPVLSQELVTKILKDQPSRRNDELTWTLNRTIVYTFASSYSIGFNFFHPLESMLAYYANKKIWNAVWGLKTPTKIRALLWMLLHNGIQVQQKLHSRIPAVDASCPWCTGEEESMIHCVTTWHFSNQVQNCMGILTSLKALPSIKFWHW